MPNWVTVQMTANKSVIEAIMRNPSDDTQGIDFNKILPFRGRFDWDGIYPFLRQVTEQLFSNTKLLPAHLFSAFAHELKVTMSVNEINPCPPEDVQQVTAQVVYAIKQMLDQKSDCWTPEIVDQLVGMLLNKYETGYTDSLNFATQCWGTKWNACSTEIREDHAYIQFNTAWSCPVAVLMALSAQHPTERISVRYADEDIGSNCGEFTLLNGQYIILDEAPQHRNQTKQEQHYWRRFACDVLGYDPDDWNISDDDDDDEDDEA